MNKPDKQQITGADKTVRKIEKLYRAVINEITALMAFAKVKDLSDVAFLFSQYPNLESKVNELLNAFSKNVVKIIEQATNEEWLKSIEKNNGIITPYLQRKLLSEEQITAYTNRNLEALKAFQTRKTNGLDLSDRVWKYTNQFKNEIEMSLDLGLREGKSAQQMSRDVRKYLNEPNLLFRRVRDQHGNLHLSKRAESYNTGQGVYRSSYKNAMRLARTEVNMAYRASDMEKYQQLDFVLGYEVRRSNHTYGCSVCEFLKGKYPKDFQFWGWHPQCRCYTVPILKPLDEFIAGLNEEKIESKSNNIEDVPDNFKQWAKDNAERMQTAKSVPYWWKENEKYIPSPQKSVLSNLPEKLTREEINKIYDSFDKLFPQVQEQNEAFAFFVQTKGDVSKLLEQPFAKDVLKLLGYDYYGESKKEVTLLQKYIPNKKIGLDAKYSLEDLRKQINHNYLNDIVYNSKRTSQNYFGELQGFNDLGVVVSASDYDKIQGENIIEVFRGVKGSKRYIDDFKYGNLYDGKGIYGNGTYVTTLKNTAQSYGDDIIEMKFDANNVKIVDFQSIKKEYFEMIKDYENSKWLNDCADLATAKGYDMIKVAVNKDEFYYVILNRTKLWIKD